MKRLRGRTAIVTGGAYSIGRAFAEALAAEGADLAVVDVRDGKGTAAEISANFGVKTISVACDVSAEDQVRDAVAKIDEDFGRVDILINNAALFATVPNQPLVDWDVGLWDQVMAVNVRGPFLMCKHVVPLMRRHGWGRIVNVGSGTAYKGLPNMSAYITSKAAILGLTRSLARELGDAGICVNTLAPGLIESQSVRDNPDTLVNSPQVIASRAIKRPGMPKDLLGALVFLASDDCAFVTGQTLVVDGGSITL